MMNHNDKDLMVATQIAYYDISPDCKNKSMGDIIRTDRKSFENTLKNRYHNNIEEYYKAYEKAKKDGKPFNVAGGTYGQNKLSEYETLGEAAVKNKRYSETIKMYDSIADGKGDYAKYENWKVVDVKNDNDVTATNGKTGFYGCVIETDEKSAILAYRGSESTNQYQKKADWGEADFGLLNSTSTRQQEVGREYAESVMNKYSNYSNWEGTGHSLGDNLITDAYLHLSKNNRDKMKIVGFDGLNYSQEYIDELQKYYRENGWDLSDATKNITHYQWSLVGAIFGGKLPGINFKTVQTTGDVYGHIGITALTQKHAVVNLKFDENGNLIEGNMDPLASLVYALTNAVDDATHSTALNNVIVAFYGASNFEKIALGVMVLTLLGLTPLGKVIIGGVIGIVLTVLLIDLFDTTVIPKLMELASKIKDCATNIINEISNLIDKAVKEVIKGLETVQKFAEGIINAVSRALKKLKEWLFKNSAGYKYASANPYISINTTTMASYASQLRSLSKRSKSLDQKMNSLYWHLGIEWDTIANLGKLLKSGVILDFAGRLDKCANYLTDTASEFNEVERELANV